MKKYLLIFVICIIITEELCCEVNLSQQQLYSKYSAQWTEYATIVDSFMLVYDFPSLNKMSRDFVKYINLARINPQLFAQTYLANYSCPTNYSNKKFDSCKQSLTQYLTKLSPRKNLIRISWDRSIACYETIDSFNLQSELDLSANPYYTKEDYLNRDFLGKDFNGSVTVDTVNNCDCSPKTGFDLAMYVLLGLDAIAENDINNFTERKKWLIDTVIVGTDTLTMFNVGIAYYHPDFVVSNFDRQVYMMYSLSTNMTKDDYILAVLNKVIGMWEPAERPEISTIN